MKKVLLYRTPDGTVVVTDDGNTRTAKKILRFAWRSLIRNADPYQYLLNAAAKATSITVADPARSSLLLPPIWDPETVIRAVGCSHATSAEERTRLHGLQDRPATAVVATPGALPNPVTEAYRFVRVAPTCEVFEKGCGAQKARFTGHGGKVLCAPRRQMVTETEFCLIVTPDGWVIGFTLMNDFTIHDLEAECTLYLPQAKEFDGCAAIGPCIYIFPKPFKVVPGGPFTEAILPPDTAISLMLRNGGGVEKLSGTARFGDLARPGQFYVDHAMRRQSIPGAMLLSMGTGIIHPKGLGVEPGDRIVMSCPLVGELDHGAAMLPDYPDYPALV